jgi:hypothetical protein
MILNQNIISRLYVFLIVFTLQTFDFYIHCLFTVQIESSAVDAMEVEIEKADVPAVESISTAHHFFTTGSMVGDYVLAYRDLYCDHKQNECQCFPTRFWLPRKVTANVGDWVVVTYDGQRYPGEVVEILDGFYKVNAMRPFGPHGWIWPKKRDCILYDPKNVVALIEPPIVAGSRGQFTFAQHI